MGREELMRQMSELQAWVESMAVSDLLEQLEPLRSADHELVGRLVQLMCFIDFNGRRAVTALQSSPTYRGRKLEVGRMQDSQVIDHLKKLVESVELPQEEKIAGLKAVDVILRIANRRHHLAHWSARRFPQADAVIILTPLLSASDYLSPMAAEWTKRFVEGANENT